MQNGAAYEKAGKKVAAKMAFYIHLTMCVAANVVLLIINLATSSGYLWFKWVLLGWGIGIVFHGLAVFALPALSSMKAQMIEKEMRRAP